MWKVLLVTSGHVNITYSLVFFKNISFVRNEAKVGQRLVSGTLCAKLSLARTFTLENTLKELETEKYKIIKLSSWF